MRVLQVVPSLNPGGGGEQVAADLAVGLAQRGHESHLLSLYDFAPDNQLAAYVGDGGVEVTTLGKTTGPSPQTLYQAKAAIQRIRPEATNTHLAGLRYSLATPQKAYGVGFHTIHNVPDRECPPTVQRGHRFAFQRGWTPVLLSELFVSNLEDVYGSVPYEVIPNGVRPPAPGSTAGRALTDGLQIMSVGRLAHQKRYDVLLRAFADLASENGQDVRLTIAGDGPDRDALEGLTADLGISERVDFLGFVTNIDELLASSDIFALASDFEGLPLSVIQALFTGLPIVATDVGAVPDLVREGQNGFLVPSDDPDRLSEALNRLVTDSDLRTSFGSTSASMAGHFELDTMVDRYQDMYQTHLEGAQ